MDLTTFLAQLWGPVILAAGIGVFLNGAYYVKIDRDIEKGPLALLMFGLFGMTAGIAQILFHNAWGTIPGIVVSLLGWGLLIKGAVFIVAPRFVDKTGDMWAKKSLVPVSGTLMLVIGAYLSWIGYFA